MVRCYDMMCYAWCGVGCMFACGAIGVVSVVGFGEMQFVAYEFAYLVAVAERFEEHVAVDAIFFESCLVVAKDAAVA